MDEKIILCVDDEDIILESLEMELSIKKKDYSIEFAQSGQEALAFVTKLSNESRNLAIIISDYIMPGMKGDDLLIKIHKLYPLSIKILLTGQASVEGIAKTINYANLYHFIEKPWDKDYLRLTVKKAAKKFEADLRLEQQDQLINKLNKPTKRRKRKVERKNNQENKFVEHEINDQLLFIRYYQTLDDKKKDWISRAAIGIICADHRISYSEKLFIEVMVKNDPREERVLNYIKMIKGNIQPRLQTLKVDKETAFDLLNNITWILVANRAIKPVEEKYFEFICRKLGMDRQVSSRFIKMVKTRIKSNDLKYQAKELVDHAIPIYETELQPRTFIAKHSKKS